MSSLFVFFLFRLSRFFPFFLDFFLCLFVRTGEFVEGRRIESPVDIRLVLGLDVEVTAGDSRDGGREPGNAAAVVVTSDRDAAVVGDEEATGGRDAAVVGDKEATRGRDAV